MLTKEDLQVLTAKFPLDTLCVKVNSFSKDRTKAMLVLYLQHTDVYARLEMVDPAWSCETISVEKGSESMWVRMRLTVKGVSRENVGEGNDLKGAYSDAIKRAAMLFGIGRYLYDSEVVWVPYNEATDRFRQWSVREYEEQLAKIMSWKPKTSERAAPTKNLSAPKPIPKVEKTEFEDEVPF